MAEPQTSTTMQEVPLRLFGKAPIDKEYLLFDLTGAPSQFYKDWVDAGFENVKMIQPPPALPHHRLLISVDHGKQWVVAVIWDSHDKPPEGRRYPLTHFVVIKAPRIDCPTACAASFCEPIWLQLEAFRGTLNATPDRAALLATAPQHTIRVPRVPAGSRCDKLDDAANEPTAPWLARLARLEASTQDYLNELSSRVHRFRESRGQEPLIWRFDIASDRNRLMQVSVWLNWICSNLNKSGRHSFLSGLFSKQQRDFALLIPMNSQADHIMMILRKIEPQDFSLLTLAGDTPASPPADVVATQAKVEADASQHASATSDDTGMQSQEPGTQEVPMAKPLPETFDMPVEAETLAGFARWVMPDPA